MKQFANVDDYIADFPEEVQELLEKVRSTIRKTIPKATEVISYGIPTFKQNKNVVHFAGYKNHIGFYPGASPIVKFKAKLKKYKTAKGSIQFPLTDPIPYDLIAEITKFRAKELEDLPAGKEGKSKKKK